MGLANKIVLRAVGPDRLDLPLHCSVETMVTDQHPVLMPIQCWPFGRDYAQAWIGGSTAWDLARGQQKWIYQSAMPVHRKFISTTLESFAIDRTLTWLSTPGRRRTVRPPISPLAL